MAGSSDLGVMPMPCDDAETHRRAARPGLLWWCSPGPLHAQRTRPGAQGASALGDHLMRAERAISQRGQITALAKVSGLHMVTIIASDRAWPRLAAPFCSQNRDSDRIVNLGSPLSNQLSDRVN